MCLTGVVCYLFHGDNAFAPSVVFLKNPTYVASLALPWDFMQNCIDQQTSIFLCFRMHDFICNPALSSSDVCISQKGWTALLSPTRFVGSVLSRYGILKVAC